MVGSLGSFPHPHLGVREGPGAFITEWGHAKLVIRFQYAGIGSYTGHDLARG